MIHTLYSQKLVKTLTVLLQATATRVLLTFTILSESTAARTILVRLQLLPGPPSSSLVLPPPFLVYLDTKILEV